MVDVTQEAEGGAEVGFGTAEQVEVIVLLLEQRLLGDAEGVEKDDGLVVEKSVGERLAR